MKNDKGFTLVEMLAVIVIISILALLAIPSVTGHMMNSRKRLFMEDALTVADAVRTDLVKGGVLNNNSTGKCNGDYCYYSLTDINKILETKIDESSFGNDYTSGDAGVCIVVNQKTNEITMTMVDSQGNGFVDLIANSSDDSKSIDNNKVNATGTMKVSDAKIATKNCIPTLKTIYRRNYRRVSIGQDIDQINTDFVYATDPTELYKYEAGFYLKHLLDNDNIVLANYVCYVLDGTEYCLQGGSSSYYSNNLSIINSSPGASQCVSSSTEDCISQFTKFSVTASPYGYATVKDNDDNCYVDAFNSSACDSSKVE